MNPSDNKHKQIAKKLGLTDLCDVGDADLEMIEAKLLLRKADESLKKRKKEIADVFIGLDKKEITAEEAVIRVRAIYSSARNELRERETDQDTD